MLFPGQTNSGEGHEELFHYKNKERLPFLHSPQGRQKKKKEEAGAGRNRAGAFVFG
jgi:hypothetical protein